MLDIDYTNCIIILDIHNNNTESSTIYLYSIAMS
eukprot:UN02879